MSQLLSASLPHSAGVYLMRDGAGSILYIGKAKDLAKRVSHYFNPSRLDSKTTNLIPLIRKMDYAPCASEREALLLEQKLIRQYQPFFNILWKDDKSYPYVKLTLNEDFPRIFLTRQKKRDGALYFGPYPKVHPVQNLMRHIWRNQLFPLRPCRWDFSLSKPLDPKKIHSCLYYHTQECPAPCAGLISQNRYKKIARDAALFFKGHYGRLKKSFQKEMEACARTLQYERAATLRDNLKALEHLGEQVRFTEISPERLPHKIQASQAVTDLQEALSLPRPPFHIEAFDISNLFGKQSVGSMVCFQGGEPHRDHYRRFRIKGVSGIDDFAMVREVVGRRYKALPKKRSLLPDLVLIDGGQGQLHAAEKALREIKVFMPLAALAKREEAIYRPGFSKPILLEKERPALRLLQHLRDEAHRFAVTYHRLLRKKKLFGEAK